MHVGGDTETNSRGDKETYRRDKETNRWEGDTEMHKCECDSHTQDVYTEVVPN